MGAPEKGGLRGLRLQYNAPVVLTFALVSLGVLGLGYLTAGTSNRLLFSVYRFPLTDPLGYVRLLTHVLGHADYAHYMGNMTLLLVLGPQLEERYGSARLLGCIGLTALVSGLVQVIFFPNTALLGASGIVFMMIILSSLAGMAEGGGIPATFLLVCVIYLGGEVVTGLTVRDNISQLTHVVGGICGGALGFVMRREGT